MTQLELCKWAVVFEVNGENYDNKEKRTNVIAVFMYPFEAQEFIDKCLPLETKSRFFIKNIDTIED